MSKLFKQTVLYTIGEVVPKVIGFFLLPIYTHYLTTGDYGILSYTNSVVMFLFVLCTLSLNSFVLRNYFDQKTEVDKKRLLGNIFLFIGAINLLLLVAGYYLLPHLISHYKIQIPWDPYFKLALINNFIEVFSIIPMVMYRVKQDAKNFLFLNLSRVIFQFGLTCVLIVVLKKGLLGHYYGRLFTLIPYFVVYWALMSKKTIFNLNFKQIKEGLRFSLPLLPGALAYLFLSFSDRIILERSVSVSAIGIFNIAYTLVFALNMVIRSGYKAIEPEIFKQYGTSNFVSFIKRTQSAFFFILYSGAMFITLYSQEVFKIMASESFYEGYLLVPILMIGVIMSGQNVIFGGILIAERNTKILGFASMIGAIVSVAFNIIFIPYWGVYAAAVSSAIAFVIMNLILFCKMNFIEKQLRQEFKALVLFMLISFGLFYIVKIDFSIVSVLIKSVAFIIYIILLAIIYKIKPSAYLHLIKKRI